MSVRPQSGARVRRPNEADRARWLVPAAIGILGLITLVLILFAFGVLLGVIRF
ncbi:MAG TPA: hypothetical protein VFH29_00810 [Anaerolineales bacterium]|nr:hypothetical protein [Anaerolineales bacterium]